MCDPKEVFKALPHVNTIWVTDDGHFHLHPHNGGEEINRDEELPIVDNGGESLKEDKPRSKGRPKNK
jgi:hypothetical protein